MEDCLVLTKLFKVCNGDEVKVIKGNNIIEGIVSDVDNVHKMLVLSVNGSSVLIGVSKSTIIFIKSKGGQDVTKQ
jgi:hypothetical protein